MTIDQYGYPCEPRYIDEASWFYVQRGGLIVVVRASANKITTIKIPWRKVERAVDRRRALKRKSR